jgi:ribosomal protein S18 acetylase RimI-like enzyme
MIRFATAADLDGIEAIYDAILTREEAGPVYTNWQRGKYPTRAHAQQALDAGTLYVGEDDGFLWGVVNLNGIQLPEYDDIPWEIAAEREQVGVIHTMCIHPAASGRGRARRMVTFCEEESRRLGKTVIRLDTWEGNVPANAMYPKLGYTFAGATEFFFQGFIHEILNCYEKKL